MSEIKHVLQKGELERLNNILSVAKIQEELLNAISLSYREYMVSVVFKRLGLQAEVFPRCVVDIQNGELIIREEVKPTPTPKTDIKT